jgi:hypothetical protein
MGAVASKPHVAVIDERLDPDADILHIVEQVGRSRRRHGCW